MWSNKRTEGFQKRKLDRVLVNEKWLHEIPTEVEFLSPRLSDHSSALVTLGKAEVTGPRPFKFFNYWTQRPKYHDLVRRIWSQHFLGNPMQVLYNKLRALKKEPKIFGKQFYGDISSKVRDIGDEIEAVQLRISNGNADDHLLKLEFDLRKQLREACLLEETHLKQKSRIQWLKAGDQNTAFFFQSIKEKYSRETIKVLYTDNGERLDDFNSISTEAV